MHVLVVARKRENTSGRLAQVAVASPLAPLSTSSLERLAPRQRLHRETFARRPETSACIKAVVEDIVKMHKTLQPLLTRHQLHAVFTQARAVCTCHVGVHTQESGACYLQVLASFDAGLLASYQGLDCGPVFTRQCIVQDVHFVRTEVDKLHLVPNVFPELVKFAQALTLHQ